MPPERAEKRILIQRNGAHGDILMASPLLTALRVAYPHAHITWVVEYSQAAAIDAHPYVDELLLWDSLYWKQMLRRGLWPLWMWRTRRLHERLRERNYDIFISYQPEEWAYQLAQGCGAPVRIGVFDTFSQTHGEAKTSRNTRHYTHTYTAEDLPPHRTDQYLLPLRSLMVEPPASLRMIMGYTALDENVVQRFLSDLGIGVKPFVILAPMTTWPSRCWPGERFAALADALRDAGTPVLLIGGPTESEPIEAIASQMKYPALTAVGTLGFREMAALIAQSALVISGDTGPMHVAAAVGTPYLALFGSTPVSGRAPLFGRGKTLMHPVPCGPCDRKECSQVGDDYLRCMRLITVDEVMDSARQLLNLGKPLTPEAVVGPGREAAV